MQKIFIPLIAVLALILTCLSGRELIKAKRNNDAYAVANATLAAEKQMYFDSMCAAHSEADKDNVINVDLKQENELLKQALAQLVPVEYAPTK